MHPFYRIRQIFYVGWILMMPTDTSSIDKTSARRAFSQAAEHYDAAAVLQHEMGERMLERLDYVKLEPERILDIGCGTGRHTASLLKRYPRAQVMGLDFALSMLQHARKQGRWLRRPQCVCGDLDQLPVAEQSIDLVFSNAALQWSCDPAKAIAGMQRVLRPGGLLMFSSFGPDTLKELRAAWSQVDGYQHVHQFVDMHDYGDMLLQAGLADPVMDMQRMTLTYENVQALMQDLKAIGAANAGKQRPRSLTGRARLRALQAAYEQFRLPDGRLPATYEVIYGHAWGAMQRQQGNEVRVSLDALASSR
jgi:malonyl-CoA O-methyltransferase